MGFIQPKPWPCSAVCALCTTPTAPAPLCHRGSPIPGRNPGQEQVPTLVWVAELSPGVVLVARMGKPAGSSSAMTSSGTLLVFNPPVPGAGLELGSPLAHAGPPGVTHSSGVLGVPQAPRNRKPCVCWAQQEALPQEHVASSAVK